MFENRVEVNTAISEIAATQASSPKAQRPSLIASSIASGNFTEASMGTLEKIVATAVDWNELCFTSCGRSWSQWTQYHREHHNNHQASTHQAEPLKAVCPLSFSAPPLLGTLKCDGAMQCKTQQCNAIPCHAMHWSTSLCKAIGPCLSYRPSYHAPCYYHH